MLRHILFVDERFSDANKVYDLYLSHIIQRWIQMNRGFRFGDLQSQNSHLYLFQLRFFLNCSTIYNTNATIKSQACFPRNPTTSPADLKINLAMAPTISGKISPTLLPIPFKPLPNLSPKWSIFSSDSTQ